MRRKRGNFLFLGKVPPTAFPMPTPSKTRLWAISLWDAVPRPARGMIPLDPHLQNHGMVLQYRVQGLSSCWGNWG